MIDGNKPLIYCNFWRW